MSDMVGNPEDWFLHVAANSILFCIFSGGPEEKLDEKMTKGAIMTIFSRGKCDRHYENLPIYIHRFLKL